MKTLIKSLKALVLFVVLISGTQAFAQDKKNHREERMAEHEAKKEQRMAEASKRLNLTAEQQTKIKAVLQANRTEMKALREANKNKAKEEKRKAMIQQMKKMDEQINTVLDIKQQEIYKQMKVEKKAEREKKRAEKLEKDEEIEDAGGGIF